MTVFQLLSFCILGPAAFILFMRGLIVLIHGKGEYHIIEALIMFICIAVILVAFLGVV